MGWIEAKRSWLPRIEGRVRIKSLQLHGFKSFVDRTAFSFDEGITAVVGPNGCGKSNVVDAIRWVMGEQSPSRLRGKGMGDVIFAGTDSRPAIGMAEVLLTFDNSDGKAPPAFAAYQEIQIARRLYRSGESEYRLNNTPCRLRDVHDFFRDTGIGVKGYTIVEQGRIAEIVSAKAEDRRILIEEAAGISKYKARRREAESKIASTEQNLTRVNDVLGEVRRQIASLERQARRASRYKRLQETQRILELSLAAEERRELQESVESEQAKLRELSDRVTGLEGRQAQAELESQEQRIALVESEKIVGQGSERLYALRSEIKELEGRIELAQRERENLTQSDEGRREELETLATQRTNAESEANQARDELQNLDRVLAEERSAVEAIESELETAGADLRQMEHNRESANGSLVEVLTEAARIEDRSAGLEDRREVVDHRLRSTERELEVQQSAVAEASRDRDQIEEGLRGLMAERDRVQELLRASLREQESAPEGVRHAANELRVARELLEARRARQDSLREVIEAQEDVSEGNRHLLSRGEDVAARFGLKGLLSDGLIVDQELEKAVDAILAERSEAILVAGAPGALAALANLRDEAAGRGVFLVNPSGEATPSGIVPLGERLLERVRAQPGFEAAARAIFGNVYLVESLHEPVDAFGQSALPATFVTAEGDVLTQDGLIHGGAQRSGGGALGRHREVRALASEIASLELRVRDFEVVHRETETGQTRLSEQVDNLRNRHHTAALALANREKDLERTNERVKTLGDAHEGRLGDRSELFEESTSLLSEREQLANESERLVSERTRCQREVDDIVLRINSSRREMTRLESRAAERKVAHRGRIESRERLQNTLERAETALRDTADWIGRREREIEAASERQVTLVAEIGISEGQLAKGLADEEGARVEAESLREAYEREADGVRALEDSIREIRGHFQSAREEASNADLKVRESELRLQHQDDVVRDRWGVALEHWEPPALDIVLPEQVVVEEEESQDAAPTGEPEEEAAAPSADELRELQQNAQLARRPREERGRELERVRGALQSLGDVNLGAIEEHEELAERFRFLSEQKDDLDATIHSLREAISRINRTSRRRFRETFAAVSERFSENFPRLFGGGKASLQLTETEDVLEAGVEIMAMPPGKRLQNVNLLSGGEKTMTALALLVAVFQVRPSPFFLLDEVDAALDDANVGRFNGLITDMASQSQFVIITHNKRTIEVADVLYGVTMEQKGVSKLVAVQLH